MKKTLLAVVGPVAVGKGTVIGMLKKRHGFESSSTSDRVREEIQFRSLEVTRESLTKIANELRENFGNDVLAKRTSEIIDKNSAGKFVIDSIRNPQEIEYFKKHYGMKVIGLVCDQKTRYKRFVERKTNSQAMTFEEFMRLDNAELYGKKGKNSQRVKDCLEMADVIIDTRGSVKNVEKKLTKTLLELGIN